MKIYVTHSVKETSNALVTLVETKQDSLEILLKTVKTTHQKFIR